MSKERITSKSAGSATDSNGAVGEIAQADIRGVALSDVNMGSMASSLRELFDRVMLGKPYSQQQVAAATNITNSIVKALRLEFDIYKHFAKIEPGKSGRPALIK